MPGRIAGRRGLKPFDPAKHARFTDALEYGFTFQAPTYPIDKSQGITDWQMEGNGPDSTLTGPFAQFAAQGLGDCGPAEVPAHANMLTAVLAGLPLASNTMTANQVATLYFTYEAEQAGATWDPSTPPEVSWDQGVDLGDWLLWLFGKGLIEGFVALKDLSKLDSALATFAVIVGGWALTDQTEEDFENGIVADVGPDNPPDPSQGHCMGLIAVESVGGNSKTDTWASDLTITAAYRSACLQQAFIVLTQQEAESKGFVAQFAALVADLKALGGTVVDPPAPGPVTPPPPTPVPGPVNPPSPTPPSPSPTPPSPTPPTVSGFVARIHQIVDRAVADIEMVGAEFIEWIEQGGDS